MRATWIVIVAAFVVLAAIVPAALPARASEGALAPARLADAADGRRIVFDGVSRISLAGICLQGGGCLGLNSTEDGRYFLPAYGSDGRVVVWWSAANASLKSLRLSAGSRVVEGESPLVIEIPGAEAGEYFVRAEPIQLVAGVYEQDVYWSASFRVDDPAPEIRVPGRSGFEAPTGCVLVLCESVIEHRSGRLVIPWNARGVLGVEWDPREGPRRVGLQGTGFVVEGLPPLALPLDGIEAGEYAVEVEPTTLARPLSVGWVGWNAHLIKS